MPPEESSYPPDWVRIAEEDFRLVARSLEIREPRVAAFYLQQAVEKFLKAFLLSNGRRLNRIHDLDRLLNDAVEFDPALNEYRQSVQRITDYYVAQRYPFAAQASLTVDDVRDSLNQVTGLIDHLREATSQ